MQIMTINWTRLLREPDFLRVIRQSSWKSWRETLSWLGFHTLGALMPLWGSYFIFRIRGEPIYWHDLTRHGEFALYAAAFLAPILQLIVNNIRDSKRVLGGIALLVGVTGLLLAALMYGTIATNSSADREFIFRASVALLLGSLTFSFFVTLIENERLTFDVRELEQQSQDKLKERFLERRGRQDAGQ